MSQSDPEAIRGIRALPGPRPISVPNYCSREGARKLARTKYFYQVQNSALKKKIKKAAWQYWFDLSHKRLDKVDTLEGWDGKI